MEIKKVHCLFEQSGTFKKEFIKLGIEAFDYDILNNFGQTDYQIDLFAEIEKGYNGEKSIFDDICGGGNLILAFFPCTRFEDQITLFFRGEANQQKADPDEKKLQLDLDLHNELHYFYQLVTKLAIIAIRKHIPMILENPAGGSHYLTRYWAIKPKVIDKDRTKNGDYFKKPTQYWFINMEPMNNLVMQPIQYVTPQTWTTANIDGALSKKESRSMIHPQYAERFIKSYILDCPGGIWQ